MCMRTVTAFYGTQSKLFKRENAQLVFGKLLVQKLQVIYVYSSHCTFLVPRVKLATILLTVHMLQGCFFSLLILPFFFAKMTNICVLKTLFFVQAIVIFGDFLLTTCLYY